MGKIFFIADTHFRGHFMLNYYERSFGIKLNSTAHYDRNMIKKWNAVIQKTDRVYVIGDFADGPHSENKDFALVRKLNGSKTLIIGTHDLGFGSRDFWYHGVIDKDLVRKYWLEVGFKRVFFDREEIIYNGVKIVMTHERTIVQDGEINVYGHNHDVPGDNKKYHNVSAPVTGFRPISVQSIMRSAFEPDHTEDANLDLRLFRQKYGNNAIYDPAWRSEEYVPRIITPAIVEPPKSGRPSDYYVFPVLDYSKEREKGKDST